jgi:hypothetical protein
MSGFQCFLVPVVCLFPGTSAFSADLACELHADRIVINDGERPVCEYRFADTQIPRPYFCNVYAPCGVQVTRTHPPGERDLADHPDFHPGIWLAFGDLSGADSWRLTAPIEHVEFIDSPHLADAAITFTVRNRYVKDDETLCDEIAIWTLSATDNAYLLSLDNRISSDRTVVFGDQEEMGLGVRLATSIAENQQKGGLLTDSDGRTTAQKVWGQPADWCDYSGIVNGQEVGVTILAHPENIRPSRWHARDYGLMVANLFAHKAFTRQDPVPIVVPAGGEFRLRFQIVIHNGRPESGYDPAAAYGTYTTR